MDYETLGNIVLLAIVTLISVVQNGFFAHKLEHESKTHNGWSFQRTGTLAFERVYTAKGDGRGPLRHTHVQERKRGKDSVLHHYILTGCPVFLGAQPGSSGEVVQGCMQRNFSVPDCAAVTCLLTFPLVYLSYSQNCVDAYPTFLVTLWSAGLLCSQGNPGFSLSFECRLFDEKALPALQLQSMKPWRGETLRRLCFSGRVPAAFAGLMYLVVRQQYFVGYLGERTQSTRGYIFGKRIILFLFLMSLAGILNYFLILLFGSDFENYMKTIATTISPLLLIP
ncbi:hypothetical protein EI555_011870 [Monodon monoceros]|uniref:Arachidonate 5-lipoxygenase-activating protein n=1 Tax=Monodon monoceros TaxID=40151 RepID=A0A4U1FRG9_MONMO|nr:hypothetical protein EI555_011870 [Monodon monoceros]